MLFAKISKKERKKENQISLKSIDKKQAWVIILSEKSDRGVPGT